MVVTLSVPLRSAFGLKDYITDRHLENMAKVILATGMIVAYGYLMEAFMAWYGIILTRNSSSSRTGRSARMRTPTG